MRIAKTIILLTALTVVGCKGKDQGSDNYASIQASSSGGGDSSVIRNTDSTEKAIVFDSSLVSGWLLLRQAAATQDSVERSALYLKIRLPVARDRIPWVEAQTLERFGNYEAALAVYRRLDAPIEVYRMLAYTRNTDSIARDEVRRELLNFIVSSNQSSNVRRGIKLYDSLYGETEGKRARYSFDDHIRIANSALDVGMRDRAVAGYTDAQKIGNLSSDQRFNFARAQYGLRQFSAAAAEFEKVINPRPLAAAARYQKARAYVAMGRTAQAISQLKAIVSAYPVDTSAAAAQLLLADLLSDAGKERESRSVLRDVIERFPDTRFYDAALIEAALSSFALKDYDAAQAEFGAMLKRATNEDGDGISQINPARLSHLSLVRYWLARTQLELGDTSSAYSNLGEIIRRDSFSYYGVLSARRLNVPVVRFSAGDVEYPRHPSVDSALKRIIVLNALDMSREVGYEYTTLFNLAGSSRDRLIATAHIFSGNQQAGRAIALGRQALNRFGPTKAIYQLIYPIDGRETIVQNSVKNGVDPIVIASLIRQESNFNPGAVSPVGARGMMQIMPNVAAEIARKKGITDWSATMLYDPVVNIEFGIAHLAPLIKRQPNIVMALAAYNAGESRITKWAKKVGAADAELFSERIPLQETKGYVRNILTNREFYRALYSW